jgi:hypothetical protein
VLKRTRLRETLGVAESWVVSIHHQSVDRVAKGFRVAARSRDGIIEAIESNIRDRWMLGVQFHPEIGTTPTMQRIFNSLVAEAARRADMPTPKVGTVKRVERHYPSVPKPTVKTVENEYDRPRIALPSALRTTQYLCFRCGIEFDDAVDHIDHMFFLHGVDMTDDMTDAEIMALVDEDGSEF